jgi:hypothetical protein
MERNASAATTPPHAHTGLACIDANGRTTARGAHLDEDDPCILNSMLQLRTVACPRRCARSVGGGTNFHYVKISNRSRSICNGPLTPVTSIYICSGCCLAPVTYNHARMTPGLASTTPVTNVDFW